MVMVIVMMICCIGMALQRLHLMIRFMMMVIMLVRVVMRMAVMMLSVRAIWRRIGGYECKP